MIVIFLGYSICLRLNSIVLGFQAQTILDQHVYELPMTLVMIVILPLNELALGLWDTSTIILLLVRPNNIAVFNYVKVPLPKQVIHRQVGAE